MNPAISPRTIQAKNDIVCPDSLVIEPSEDKDLA
jgi:hypothetical protein